MKEIVSYDARSREWTLETPVEVAVDEVVLVIPKGYRFDMASVPKAFWSFIGPHELSIAAPLLHDWLYDNKGVAPARTLTGDSAGHYRQFTRAEADNLFLRLMEVEGVTWWKRRMAHAVVRAIGWFWWRAGPPLPGLDLPQVRRQAEAEAGRLISTPFEYRVARLQQLKAEDPAVFEVTRQLLLEMQQRDREASGYYSQRRKDGDVL